MARFHNHGIFPEALQQRVEVLAILHRVLERPGKLRQHRAQASAGGERIGKCPEAVLIGIHGIPLVRKYLMKLGGELEARIRVHVPQPLFGCGLSHRAVERRVDFRDVEELRDVTDFSESGRAPPRVDHDGPIAIVPSCRAYPDVALGLAEVASWEHWLFHIVFYSIRYNEVSSTYGIRIELFTY